MRIVLNPFFSLFNLWPNFPCSFFSARALKSAKKLANTSSGGPHKSKTLICLPMNLPGVNVANKIKKIGMFSSDTGQIFFDSVRVPQRYRIGEEGLGFTYQMQQFQEERYNLVISYFVPMQMWIDLTIEFTQNRDIFGKSILQLLHANSSENSTIDLESVSPDKSPVLRT